MSRPHRSPTDLPRTTRGEIHATLTMVQARLQAEPDSVEEWQIIVRALRSAANASQRHLDVRVARVAARSPGSAGGAT
jgi:hypothetical protein